MFHNPVGLHDLLQGYFYFPFLLVTKEQCWHNFGNYIICFSCFTVTVVSWCVIVLLVCFEIRDYWTPTISEELFVDTSRGPKLRINLDFIIPAISCECELCPVLQEFSLMLLTV